MKTILEKSKKDILTSFVILSKELSIEELEDLKDYIEVLMIRKEDEGEKISLEKVIEESEIKIIKINFFYKKEH